MRTLFFDIDGTLVSFTTHKMPPSAIEALRCAKARGMKIVIATGRPMSIITNIGEISDLVDGYITMNGACCYVDGEVVSVNAIPKTEWRGIVDFCRREGAALYAAGTESIVIFQPTEELRRFYLEVTGVDALSYPDIGSFNPDEPMVQVTAFIDKVQEERLMPYIPSCLATRWHPTFTDIISSEADKGKALLQMCCRFGADPADSIAFGDGGNDVPMIEAAGIGVAMGNAFPEVKAAADIVTDSVDSDGIMNAFLHLGLI